MSLRKFISGVTAFAVAATAFAAMAVTASAATTYPDVAVIPGTILGSGITNNNNNGTYSITNTKLNAVVADLSNLTDIDKASSVTVKFKAKASVPDDKTVFAKIVYGVGDKKIRKLNGAGTTANNYKTDGIVSYFGSQNGTAYGMKDYPSTYDVNTVGNKDLNVEITLDRVNKRYSASVGIEGTSDAMTKTNVATDVDNITVIEAVTWGAIAAYDVVFKDIKVTYTVPPYANLETAAWTDGSSTGYTASGNVLTDTNENSVYGYKATLTADGTAYNSVKVAVTTNETEPRTKTKTYSEYNSSVMTTGNAVFYVISDVELNTNKSYVYFE